MPRESITTSAPGRICLFGEHQDYLGLPVVAMAVNLRFYVEYRPNRDDCFTIHTPDLPGSEVQSLDIHASAPRHDQDFCWGIAQALKMEGFRLPSGGKVTFRSEIPVKAGCSSSSAMSAAWMRLLIEIGEHSRKELYLKDPESVAYLVYKGEKELFGGAGGMMDQYSCYLGGLLHVYPVDIPGSVPYSAERLDIVPSGFILIDSGEPKDTQGILKGVGDRARRAISEIQSFHPPFNLSEIELSDFDLLMDKTGAPAGSGAARIVRDHIINRDICRLGLAMLRLGLDEVHMGALLNEEHRILSGTLQISTPLIDKIQALTLDAGALGAKINGSGGGGTLFCYAPKNSERIAKILNQKDIRNYPIVADAGARVDA